MPKARVIHESPEPVTGLGFREPSYGQRVSDDRIQPSLFIVTISRVLSASVSSRGGEPTVLEDLGADLGCAAMDAAKRELVVARDDAIYTYGPDGRAQTFAYEGTQSLHPGADRQGESRQYLYSVTTSSSPLHPLLPRLGPRLLRSANMSRRMARPIRMLQRSPYSTCKIS